MALMTAPLMAAHSGLALGRLVSGWLQVAAVADQQDSSSPQFSPSRLQPLKANLCWDSIVVGLRRKESNSLLELIEVTRQSSYRLAHSMLGDAMLCQDVLQEAYCMVFDKIEQLKNPQALRSWLAQIVANLCRQQLRRRYRQDLPLDELSERLSEPSEHNMEERLAVQDILSRLPLLDRTVLAMREVFDLSYQEIAEALEIPVGTVRSRIFNARRRFVEMWEEPK